MARSLWDFCLSDSHALRSAGAAAMAAVVLIQTASELMFFDAVPFRTLR